MENEAQVDHSRDYQVPVKCNNCGLKKKIWLPKGIWVKYSKCPECGCSEALELVEIK